VPTLVPTKKVYLQRPAKLPHQFRQPRSPPPLHLQHKNSVRVERKSQLNMRWTWANRLFKICGSQCLGGPSWPERVRLSVDPLDMSWSDARFRSFCLNKQITESHGSLFSDCNFGDLCRKHLAMPWLVSLVVTVMPSRDAIRCVGQPMSRITQ
jgi:hypothetical protein